MSSTTIPTEGDAPDMEVTLNGESLRWDGAGGWDDEGYVQGRGTLDGEDVLVHVHYDTESGGVGAEIVWEDRDLTLQLDWADNQPETGARFTGGALGVEATVTVSPEDDA